ncbi:VCBS repeat-containing protein [Robertkochia solimangrovi]|uniref:VCBS repeat-containing protein n=1 Tax=Robertkochia solimangrovi TaxID=2213046 RepID=UPI00117F5FA6|nr:VCBS repeat-containing protein [Robertkochia solimangrovi]TRZ43309.1 hypothetical protein DMZ48_11550 [Robertkochia solimangrovi]
MKYKPFITALILLLFTSCEEEDRLFSTPDPKACGIDFENILTETDELNILDYLYFYNGGGVAVGDINNDGLPDIYLTGNQVKNKLYLNKGNLQFEDITEQAGVQGNSSWNTAAVMGDLNNDGFLDIYTCAVVGINDFTGHNELFINNGDLTFTEASKEYGLDHDSFSSSAAFLDYDGDNDLDIYLLNHAVHTQESYGSSDLRTKRNYATGDKLLRNDGGHFTDVSEEAGIFGGVNGFGLGVSIADFNQDGYPDIYVGNDFHEDDYYYLNQGDGTFKECLKDAFAHISRFSMGNDAADLNHDGYPDIISLDMLPEEETVLKSSEGDENTQMLEMRINKLGYAPQFTRNMLQVNQKGENFTETALLSGVAATDWSWSALFADYNQDGEQDLFISNGIPKRPNDLDYIKFISNEQIRNKLNDTRLIDQKALKMMPSGNHYNYVFEGSSTMEFKDRSGEWIRKDTIISGATAIADFDNDGDLDLITNNLNRTPTLYINNASKTSSYLKISVRRENGNTHGTGTAAIAWSKGIMQYRALYPTRGFQASSEPILHFGFGQEKNLDSLLIIFPDHTFKKFKEIPLNQTLTVHWDDVSEKYNYAQYPGNANPLFTPAPDNFGLDFIHKEDDYLDFNRQKLIPYRISDRGPATAIGDLNGDGLTDLFFGSSKSHSPVFYRQSENGFQKDSLSGFNFDDKCEEVSALITDLNNDGMNDLITGNGGGDFYGRSSQLQDRILSQTSTGFNASILGETYDNTSVIAEGKDQKGKIFFTGSHTISYDFGNLPVSRVFRWNNGMMTAIDLPDNGKLGMVTDALWEDLDKDGNDDLIVVGEWMAPRVLLNKGDSFIETKFANKSLFGLWQSIASFDMDNDGDKDLVLGNWGSNSKFTASSDYPMHMYYADFDDNGRTETIVTTMKNGEEYPLESMDELAGQMVGLMRKKFHNYRDFAGSDIRKIIGSELMEKATIFTVTNLRSGWLENKEGSFVFHPFPNDLQVSPITCMLEYDFDNDGNTELLTAGNYFGVKPFQSRFDGFGGALIHDQNNIIKGSETGLDLFNKAVRHLNIVNIDKKPYLLVTNNNAASQLYTINQTLNDL